MNANEPGRFYAFLDTGLIQYLGHFQSMNQAMDNEPANTHWVLSEEGLEQLLESGKVAKEAKHLPK